MTVFMAEPVAMAVVAMAIVANNIGEATEATRKVPESSSNPVHTSPVESLTTGYRTAKRTLQRVLPPPY
jgi:hypothetical protein